MDDQRFPGAQQKHCLLTEIAQAVVADDAWRTRCRIVAANGEAVLVSIHVGVRAVGQLQLLDHQPGARRQDCLRIGGIGHRFADGIEDGQALVEINGLGGLGDRVEHADDIAQRVTNRAVTESEERLLRTVAAFDLQGKVFDVGGLAGIGRLGYRADLMPGFFPDVAERTSQRMRLVAENRHEGVVIESDQLRAPDDRLREMRRETERDSGLEYIGPVFQRAEGRIRPVVTADLPGHLAVVLQPVCHGVRIFPGICLRTKTCAQGVWFQRTRHCLRCELF